MLFTVDDELLAYAKPDSRIYLKGEVVFEEGCIPNCFLYLKDGEISVYNFTPEGKEFLQHKISEDSFFAEPATLLECPFPGTAEISSEKAEVMRIPRKEFLEYMTQHPERLLEFSKSIAHKSIRKSLALRNIVFHSPEERIINHLKTYKEDSCPGKGRVLIDLTRRELSNMTGLRVETIIRAVKKLERAGRLEIIGGKIYF